MYPDIEPYKTGTLKGSNIHTVYYELSGNDKGNPVLFLHGGPGGGASPQDRRFFNPEKYKIIIFDQRGSGRSTPTACLIENTTQHLLSDIEQLRELLGIEMWNLFGGSWGSTLALAYAQAYPSRVKSLVLRGFFTARQSEIDYSYKPGGMNRVFPDAYEDFLAPLPPNDRSNPLEGYRKLFESNDETVRLGAARIWTLYEIRTSKLIVKEDDLSVAKGGDDRLALSMAVIENHYFRHGAFFRESQLLDPNEIAKIKNIPTVVVQGRYDMICPIITAYEFKSLFPEVTLHIIPDAGHSSRESGTAAMLVQTMDEFADN